ncbi:hypothetical protein ACFQYP_18600 [Nonomuraea antimicrobica]|uniref:hypothetical protein n=1 Tax=Nonomuraea antimicrobica TaxID=561173 RepID=UPI0031E7ECA9
MTATVAMLRSTWTRANLSALRVPVTRLMVRKNPMAGPNRNAWTIETSRTVSR